jgi:hypothetical protein
MEMRQKIPSHGLISCLFEVWRGSAVVSKRLVGITFMLVWSDKMDTLVLVQRAGAEYWGWQNKGRCQWLSRCLI